MLAEVFSRFLLGFSNSLPFEGAAHRKAPRLFF
jgi:hypothetical protein